MKLVLDGFVYLRDKVVPTRRGKTTYWKCRDCATLKCRGRIIQRDDMMHVKGEHCHKGSKPPKLGKSSVVVVALFMICSNI